MCNCGCNSFCFITYFRVSCFVILYDCVAYVLLIQPHGCQKSINMIWFNLIWLELKLLSLRQESHPVLARTGCGFAHRLPICYSYWCLTSLNIAQMISYRSTQLPPLSSVLSAYSWTNTTTTKMLFFMWSSHTTKHWAWTNNDIT